MSYQQSWAILGLRATTDEREIKRAYARALKANRPEDDPQAFQELRTAYEHALHYARIGHRYEDDYGEQDALESMAEPALAGSGAASADAAASTGSAVQAAVAQPCAENAFDAPHPVEEARRVFISLIPELSTHPKHALAKADRSDDLLNFDVRDCFELCAAEYAASEACPENARNALVEHFGWNETSSSLGERAPWVANAVLARWRASASYERLNRHAATDRAVRHLLADRMPRSFALDLIDAGFARRMRKLIETVRWQYPELLEYRLNPDVVRAWEAHLAAKRYYAQTAIYSFIAGMALWTALLVAYADTTTWFEGDNGLLVFFGAQALSVGATALLVLKPPRALYDWLRRLHDDTLAPRFDALRHAPAARFGWIGVFAALSLGMFVPLAEAAQTVLHVALWGCLALAAFVYWDALGWKGELVSALAGFSVGLMIQLSDALPGLSFWAAMPLGGILALLSFNGGEELFQRAGGSEKVLLRLRYAWLAGAAGIVALTAMGYGASLALHVAAWTLVLCGVLLSRATLSWRLAWVALVLVRVVTAASLGSIALDNPRLPLLLSGIFIVGIFMVINMYRAEEAQNHFS